MDDDFEHISRIDTDALKNKRREWLKELGIVQSKQMKCLNKRIYLYLHKGFILFEC
jgi:hypothetical protein